MNTQLKNIFLILLLTFAASCTINAGDRKKNVDTKEYTSEYICPMHCEGSGSDSAGICPVCGMDYVQKDSLDHEGHDH